MTSTPPTSLLQVRMPVVRVAFGLLVFIAVPLPSALADDTGCKPLFDSMTHMFKTPSHQYVTEGGDVSDGQPSASELINTGQAVYIRVGGKWHNGPFTAEQMQEQENVNRKNAKVSRCRLLRDETIDGVPATLYSAHTETAYGSSEQQIWIAKASGLPLRETIDMRADGQTRKDHVEVRVVYSGIEVPKVIE